MPSPYDYTWINISDSNTFTQSFHMISNSLINKILVGFVYNKKVSAYRVSLSREWPNNNMPTWIELAINENKKFCELEDEFRSLDSRINDRLLRCQNCNRYLDLIESSRVQNPTDDIFGITEERWCYSCVQSEYFYCWSDGVYRKEQEPYVPDYHSIPRSKILQGVNFKDPSILGLEIETYIPGNSYNVATVAAEAVKLGKVIAEKDGSLSRSNGIEFIFAPIPFKNITKDCEIHKIISFLLQKNATTWSSGYRYGMHINVNANTMTTLHCSKFCYFINTHPSLCEIVGGRPENEYCRYQTGRLVHATSVPRHSAVNRQLGRAEVRLFRSSLNWDRIRRNCEFVDSVRVFTKIASMRELNPSKYCEFVQSNTEYRLLRPFLANLPTREIAFSKE